MQHVLAAVDFSKITDSVIQQAESMAQAFGAKLTLLHVAAPNPDFVGFEAGPQTVRDARAGELKTEHSELEKRAAQLREAGVDARSALVEGTTIETILREADRLDSCLIIIGSHGYGKLYDAVIGSVSAGVVRRSSRPVLIVPDKQKLSEEGV